MMVIFRLGGCHHAIAVVFEHSRGGHKLLPALGDQLVKPLWFNTE